MKNLAQLLSENIHVKPKEYVMIKPLLIMIMSIMCGHTRLNTMARFAKSHREELAKVKPLPRGKRIPFFCNDNLIKQ